MNNQPATATTADGVSLSGRLQPRPGMQLALLVSVFVVAACGLIYELIAAAIASYLLGDSVLQFSTVIGTYLFAMGVGSYLSRFLVKDLPGHFIRIEMLVGVIGGFMPVLLFIQHAWAPGPFQWVLYAMVLLVGILVGLEIPLVMRLLRGHYRLKDLVSQVLTFDYLGALVVSLAFPLFFVPLLGMIRTGLFFGLANLVVAVWAIAMFRDQLPDLRTHIVAIGLAIAALLAAFAGADRLMAFAEARLYSDRVIYAESSQYQRIVLTQHGGDLRLHLNGNLQFASSDEYRYHESLVLPILAAHPDPKSVLILGGGDGLAAREFLRHSKVGEVTLVDLDSRVTELFSSLPVLTSLNEDALNDDRLTVINTDALSWLQSNHEYFDLIVVDLPDPSNYSLGKLYSKTFYEAISRRLRGSGFAVIQTTSPMYARQSYWSIVETIEAAGLQTRPYHAVVPSFGIWGFAIASHRPFPLEQSQQQLSQWPQAETYSAAPRYLTPKVLGTLFEFPADMQRIPAQVNRLQDPVLVRYYQAEWGKAPD